MRLPLLARLAGMPLSASVALGLTSAVTVDAQMDNPAAIASPQTLRQPLPDFDIRVHDDAWRAVARARRDQMAGLAVRQQAERGLGTRIPQLAVSYDELTGSPKYIRSRRTLLSEPLAPADQPQLAARRFIERHPALTGLAPQSLDEAQLVRNARNEKSGVTSLWWRMQVDGVPVYGCEVRANVTADGRIASFSSTMPPAGIPLRIAAEQLDAAQALTLAAQAVDAPLAGQPVVAEQEADRTTRFAPIEGLSSLTSARFVYFPVAVDELRPAWIVTTGVQGDPNLYEVFIDAANGQLLKRENITSYALPATYRVFADAGTFKPEDNPAPLSPGPATPDGSQGAAASRTLITLESLDATASPNGWLNTGASTTLGNNVDAYLDRDDDDSPDLPRLSFDPFNRVLDFPYSAANAPLANADAAVTQLFYITNWYHDRLYQLGFTEPFANFQTSNFGKGGTGGDAVQAQAQDGADLAPPNANNANFAASSFDGGIGRMQMFLWDGPTPDRDGAFDTQIVIHELTHGLSIRLHGGLNGDQPDGMGEGWSDFYALALLADPTDDVNGVYGVGQWATFQGGGTTFDDNYYYGIRRYPYTTDMNKNPTTYADIDPTTFDVDPAIPRNPFFGSSFPAQVHNIGTVWCAILWEVRANLVNKHGFAVGNELALQLVTDGMKLSAPNPNFVEARDAILLADITNNSGANLPELWAGFAKRGLGVDAQSPLGTLAANIVESFNLPDGLDFVYPSGRPDRVDPAASLEITVDISEQALTPASLDPASVTLFFDAGGTGVFQPIPMTLVSPGQYTAVVPRQLCSQDIRWYVSAQTTDGFTFTDPPGAPAQFHDAPVTTFESVRLNDNFETDMGWVVNPDGTDTATTGIWVREAPIGTGFQPSFDNPTGTGTICYVTGNAPAGSSVGTNDVDNGLTTLMSPRFDCTGGPCIVSYHRWFGPSSVDSLTVAISNDDGATWAPVEDQQYLPAWSRKVVQVDELLAPTDQMRLRFIAGDTGTPSIVEAAVDDVVVSVLRCLAADVDRDGFVGPGDLFALLGSWGQPCAIGSAACAADIDGDGAVGPGDLFGLLGNWGAQ